MSDEGSRAAGRWPLNLLTRLDFVTLKLFVAIIEEASIVKAAEREFIAPSAVSKRIADLEHAAQVQLLLRQRKGIQPTAAGEAMLLHARAILRDLAQMELAIGDYATGARGHVRIAASESALMQFVPQVLEIFNRQHPQIRIDLRAEVSLNVVQSVLDNGADIGIFWGTQPTEDLLVAPCYEDRLAVVVPPEHALAQKASVKFSDVLEFEIIEQEQNSSVQALLAQAAAELNRPLRSRIRVGGYDAACNMALAGFGVAIVPDSFASRMRPIMRFAVAQLDETWALRQYKICIRESAQTPAATRLLCDHFLGCA